MKNNYYSIIIYICIGFMFIERGNDHKSTTIVALTCNDAPNKYIVSKTKAFFENRYFENEQEEDEKYITPIITEKDKQDTLYRECPLHNTCFCTIISQNIPSDCQLDYSYSQPNFMNTDFFILNPTERHRTLYSALIYQRSVCKKSEYSITSLGTNHMLQKHGLGECVLHEACAQIFNQDNNAEIYVRVMYTADEFYENRGFIIDNTSQKYTHYSNLELFKKHLSTKKIFINKLYDVQFQTSSLHKFILENQSLKTVVSYV